MVIETTMMLTRSLRLEQARGDRGFRGERGGFRGERSHESDKRSEGERDTGASQRRDLKLNGGIGAREDLLTRP